MKRIVTSVMTLLTLFCLKTKGQPGMTYDLKKPVLFENRPLGYEKSDKVKFSNSRRFIQNTITHYNFFFNTNVKLNEVVTRAKAGFKDDFTALIPFYNYSLETTSKDKRNLDSVLDKVNTAILVRDLRNDWTDNMYMLMGEAYYYKNNLDSAVILFQFINYAYAPRDRDNYPIPIGSNYGEEEGKSAISISTKETHSVVKKAFSRPPSRNESFVWQIRTWIQRDEMTRAGVMIDLLRHDPNFPERLLPALNEVQALWFYKRGIYDSSATHLGRALDNAATQAERARWEYLMGQMWEKTGDREKAKKSYEKSFRHTLDPVMDVYARLNAIRQSKKTGQGDEYIKKNIRTLRRMARKELYNSYQDIIYYAAAEMQMERNDTAAAIAFWRKSIAAPGAQETTRNKAFLKIGWLDMDKKDYVSAKSMYDSVSNSDINIADSLLLLTDRRAALDRVVPQMLIIRRQDSLQRLAAMPEAARNAVIRKMLRAYRKQLGLAEDEKDSTSGNSPFQTNKANADMFSDAGAGEWYFNNSALRSRGFNEFKSKWGNRPNVDNWMLQSMANRNKQVQTASNAKNGNAADQAPVAAAPALTAAMLLKNIPLTPELLQASNDSVETAMFSLGKGLQDNIPDYRMAIFWYDSLETRFPASRFYQESLFNKYYCYRKLGDSVNANLARAKLKDKFPAGRYLALIEHPPVGAPDQQVHDSATRSYEQIYDEMVAGHYLQALKMKRKQDSLYGEKYWSSQLLYVEALYYMHIRYDSTAKSRLNAIIARGAGLDMAIKAKNTLRVLDEREKLEIYLQNLRIKRAKEDSAIVIDSMGNKTTVLKKDTVATAKKLNTDSLRRAADSLRKIVADSNKLKPGFDSAGRVKPAFVSAFTFESSQPHAVGILMTQVDPVYITETKNAFDRFNRENYYGKTYDINTVVLSDSLNLKLVLIRGFANAEEAQTYLGKVGPRTGREIIPWLAQTKYQFIVIDDHNLEVLQGTRDIPAYKKFLSYYYPGIFTGVK